MHSVRTDSEKHIFSERTQTEELYDLRADPGEKNNIAANNRPRLKRYSELREVFLERVAAGRTPSALGEPKAPPLTEKERQRFNAIGYM